MMLFWKLKYLFARLKKPALSLLHYQWVSNFILTCIIIFFPPTISFYLNSAAEGDCKGRPDENGNLVFDTTSPNCTVAPVRLGDALVFNSTIFTKEIGSSSEIISRQFGIVRFIYFFKNMVWVIFRNSTFLACLKLHKQSVWTTESLSTSTTS